MALGAGAPAVITSMLVLWLGDYTPRVQWTLTAVIGGVWLGFCFALRERVASPLRTLANLLEAMREGDYSIRARNSKSGDAMGEVMQQVNAMSATLREQRLGALEATPQRTEQRTFPGGTARWGVSRSLFREGGLPHQLVVVTDLTQPLREEELKAWQRLVRVLGEQLKNY